MSFWIWNFIPDIKQKKQHAPHILWLWEYCLSSFFCCIYLSSFLPSLHTTTTNTFTGTHILWKVHLLTAIECPTKSPVDIPLFLPGINSMWLPEKIHESKQSRSRNVPFSMCEFLSMCVLYVCICVHMCVHVGWSIILKDKERGIERNNTWGITN